MNNMNRQTQLKNSHEIMLDDMKARTQEESTLAEEIDALSYQRDLLNYELATMQKRLKQLRTYIQMGLPS